MIFVFIYDFSKGCKFIYFTLNFCWGLLSRVIEESFELFIYLYGLIYKKCPSTAYRGKQFYYISALLY